jgi:ATP synthase in type III secretion protein N
MPPVAIGTSVVIESPAAFVRGTVRAIDGERVLIVMHGAVHGLVPNSRVRESIGGNAMFLGTCALGRAIEPHVGVLDGGPPLRGSRHSVEIDERLALHEITEPMWTGVRAIDALLTIGRGARVGIFGSPGVGKSTLLETIVEGTSADAVIVGLLGERGREAQVWIGRRDRRTTLVCATSDRSAGERLRAAHVTMAHARALARRGLHVLVLLDSLARVAFALRELANATGESVGRGGYPPSVFAELAQLVERAGSFEGGSVTLLATVLNDGDDRDPVSEAARSLLDGHLQLSTDLAQAGRFPAIDILASTSRTMGAVVSAHHFHAALTVRRAIARLNKAEDGRSLGIEPQDEPTQSAIAAEEAIEELLRQGPTKADARETLAMLAATADMVERGCD